MNNKNLYGTVDIGGTKIMTGITDCQGVIKSFEKFPTLELEVSLTMDKIIESLRKQCQDLGMAFTNLKGLGIVCAGPVDIVKGTVENPYTLPGWDHYPIVSVLSRKSGLSVKLENDVNGALLGEIVLKGLQKKRVLMTAFGTGIGCAFAANGVLYRAGDGFHPELGHMIVSFEDDSHTAPCYCGQYGCFERLWSGTALHKRAKAMGYDDFNHLYDSWKTGDQTAAAFIKKIRRELQTGIWNLGVIFKPEVVILGGGIMSSYFDFAQDALMEIMQDRDDFMPPFQILQADPEHNPALIGGMELCAFSGL